MIKLSGITLSNKAMYAVPPLLFGGIGALTGAATGKEGERGKRALVGAGIGAAIGGKMSYDAHKFIGMAGKGRHQWNWGGGYKRGSSASGTSTIDDTMFDSLKKAKTRSEANAIRKEYMMKHHPDKGGTKEGAQKANAAWDHFKNLGHLDKLSYLRSVYANSFNDELEKIGFHRGHVKAIGHLLAAGAVGAGAMHGIYEMKRRKEWERHQKAK